MTTVAESEVLQQANLAEVINWKLSRLREPEDHIKPHDKLPISYNGDYNNDREFFQEEGLEGSFEIDLSDMIGMEVDNERVVDEEAGDEVENIHDLELLERLRLGRDSEDDIPPSDSAGYVDIADSDDEDYDLANSDHDNYF